MVSRGLRLLSLVVLVAIVAVPAAGASPTANERQSQWEDQVEAQLDRVAADLLNRGYRLLARPLTGALEYDDDHDFRVTLNRHTEYVFVGVCDNDCGDLDLLLYDENDTVIAQDVLPDYEPVIQGAPGWGGDYWIEAYMAGCSAEPCYYGIGIFGRTTASDQWQQQVNIQLDSVTAALAQQGFQLIYQPITGALDNGGAETFRVRGNRHTEYAIVGVCDTDCSDIDLVVYDRDGQIVGEDRDVDDSPTVVGAPPRNGQFWVQPLMISCRAEPCYYGVGIYAR